MTVEHHHKEDETLIAKSLKNAMQVVKTPPSRTTWLVLVVAILLVVLVGSWFYFTSTAAASNSALWLKLDETNPADLEKFAADPAQQGAIQGRFARARFARRTMQHSVALLGSNTDRDGAIKEVEKARDLYQKLVQESGDTPSLMQEGLMGVAKASETLGDLGRARQNYEQLAREYPNTVFGKEAADRVKALGDEDSKKEIEALAAEFAAAK